jgi:hypothetical protein
MNTKYIDIYPKWHCRRAGGLFLGIRVDFPTSIYDGEAFANNHIYRCVKITLGFIAFSVTINIKYNYVRTFPI